MQLKKKLNLKYFLGEAGSNKIAVIKEVRNYNWFRDLKKQKILLRQRLKTLKKDVAKAEAEEMKKKT